MSEKRRLPVNLDDLEIALTTDVHEMRHHPDTEPAEVVMARPGPPPRRAFRAGRRRLE
jgi:hypothetical protein